MANHLQRSTTTGHLLKTATGHLANTCASAAIPCDECRGNGPITATITTTGSCDETGDCDWDCSNDVVSLTYDGVTYWYGDTGLPSVPVYWEVTVDCTADVWTITVKGGCGDNALGEAMSEWNDRVFTPSGCEEAGDPVTGYPTHAGIALGAPDIEGGCYVSCQPTVALS